MEQKTKLSYLFIIVLTLGFGLASFVAVAKSENAKNDKGPKTSSSKSNGKKKSETVNLKVYKQPNVAAGETHAKIHKEKTKEVVQELEQVATEEKSAGNIQVSNQVEQVVEEQEQIQDETTEAIEQVESKGQAVKFILGPDYKNLGQLRSSLVHNRNEIRKLTKALNLTTGTGNIISGSGNLITGTANQSAIEQQLVSLYQERERMRSLILSEQDTFSLFGWVSRFMNGYQPLPAVDPEEDALTDEVENAIDNTGPADTTPPGVPTTIPTTTSPTTTTTSTTPTNTATSPTTAL